MPFCQAHEVVLNAVWKARAGLEILFDVDQHMTTKSSPSNIDCNMVAAVVIAGQQVISADCFVISTSCRVEVICSDIGECS